MQRYVTGARIVKGVMTIRNRRQFDAIVKSFKDGEYTVTVERAHATRSKAQNDFYYAVVVKLIADHTGYDPKDAHELLKALHLPHDRAATGENGRLMNHLVIGGSTTKLNKLEFIEYLERCVRWAAEELDVVIPDPDPEWKRHAQEAA